MSENELPVFTEAESSSSSNVLEWKVRLQNAHDSKRKWEANNPVLLDGELAVVYDDFDRLVGVKIGNDVDAYNDLDFFSNTSIASSQSAVKIEATLDHTKWIASENSKFPYVCIIESSVFTTDQWAWMFVDADSADAAATAELYSVISVHDGYVEILSKKIPASNLEVTFILQQIKSEGLTQDIAIKWIGYYGSDKKVLDVSGYDLLIVESDNIGTLTASSKRGKKCLAYLAIAEVNPSRWYYNLCEGKSFMVETNTTWGSYRTNPASSEWQDILLNTVAPKILDEMGYDGIFFDVCDVGEYLEDTYPGQYEGAVQGIADIIKGFKKKWPKKLIACNGGYTPILDASDSIDFYVAESAIGTWTTGADGSVVYTDAGESRKNWLYPRIAKIADTGIEILDWEYADLNNHDKVNEIKQQAISKGWNPFVTNRAVSWYPGLPVPEETKPNAPEVPADDKISFIAATDCENMDFFGGRGYTLPPVNKFKVYINDEETEQEYTSLTFAEGDKVDIQLMDNKSYYPPFILGHWDKTKVHDNVREFLEPFPQFFTDSTGYSLKVWANAFTFCSNLTTVCEGLFKNNPQMNTAYYLFAQSGLTAVPQKLFENCSDITTFEGCFSGCTKLTVIASDLLEYSPKVTTLTYCFSSIGHVDDLELKIASPSITTGMTFPANQAVKFYIPANSVTYDTFMNYGRANYTFETY